MKKSLYITMDMDWANDGVIADTISLVESLEIPVCFFVTNPTPMLEKLRFHPLFTLGIHPNFLPQLTGQTTRSYSETLRELHELVPEARVIRCHALVDATPILAEAQKLGFRADMNLFIPFSSGIELKPFSHFTGLSRLPFFYEDDAWTQEPNAADPEQHLHAEGLKIFNFHPIHLYLNTEDMSRYNKAKPYYHDFEKLAPFVNRDGQMGARDFLTELSKAAKENGMHFGKVSDLWA